MSRSSSEDLGHSIREDDSVEENSLIIQNNSSAEITQPENPLSYLYDGPLRGASLIATSSYFENVAIGFGSIAAYQTLRFSFIPLGLSLLYLQTYIKRNPTNNTAKKASRATLITLIKLFNNAGFSMDVIADTISIFFLQAGNSCAVGDISTLASIALIFGSLFPPLPAAIRAGRIQYYNNEIPEERRPLVRKLNNGAVDVSRALNWGAMAFSIVHAIETAAVFAKAECSPPRIARYAIGLVALAARFAASFHPRTDTFLIENSNIALGASFLTSRLINIIAVLMRTVDVSDILYIPAILMALVTCVIIIRAANKPSKSKITVIDDDAKDEENKGNEKKHTETDKLITPMMKN